MRAPSPPPRLASGIELLGEDTGSGLVERPYLVRHADGTITHVTHLLYLVAENLDGRRGPRQIAERVTTEFQRRVSAENVDYLVTEKLRPLGIVEGGRSSDGTSAPRPVLALGARVAVLPARAVSAITKAFLFLFWPPVVSAVTVAVVAFDVWVSAAHDVTRSFRELLLAPGLMLVVLLLTVASAAFHEVGHATACRFGGAKPGRIGAGLYLVWPAFFSDVTDSYRLKKGARVRTDLGGIYFNLVAVLCAGAAYLVTSAPVLVVFVVVQHVQIAFQFVPFVRLDGYYVVADLVGVPDLFPRIRPIVRSWFRGAQHEPLVASLRPRVRAVVTGWVLLTIPVLIAGLIVSAARMPSYLSTTWLSWQVRVQELGHGLHDGNALQSFRALVQIAILSLPSVGIVLLATRLARSIRRWAMTPKAVAEATRPVPAPTNAPLVEPPPPPVVRGLFGPPALPHSSLIRIPLTARAGPDQESSTSPTSYVRWLVSAHR